MTGGNRAAPAPVTGTYLTVDAGYSYTCAIDATGNAYCWGYGESGKLGTGLVADASAPTPVAGGLTFADVEAGGRHTCAVTDDAAARAYCWGYNGDGELGNNATDAAGRDSVPVAVVDTFGGLAFTDITAGPGPRSCGTTSTRTYCWGRIGDGATSDSTPQPVSAVAITPDSTDFSRISAGQVHTCAVRDANAAL